MNNCKTLAAVTQKLIPSIYEKIEWTNIWNRKLESGTAFEWAVLASLIYVAEKNNINISVPLIEDFDAGDFFILRNEIPLTHGAQAGNSATALSSKALNQRFLYSLVPKVILEINGTYYSVFREGCPYHKIMCGQNYLERTDIIIIPGKPTSGYPKLNSSGTEVIYSYDYKNETLTGVLRVRNSPLIPCKSRFPRNNLLLKTIGIVECSVNKSEDVATAQLQKYDDLFSTELTHPALSLITGNDLTHLAFDAHHINLNETPEIIFDELVSSAEGIMKNFNLID